MIEVQAEEKTKRRSYRREFKLHVVKWYTRHGENKAQTAYHFNVDRKRVREWVQNEEMIRETKNFTRKKSSGRRTQYPIAERQLHTDFKILRQEGKSIKRYWFNNRMG